MHVISKLIKMFEKWFYRRKFHCYIFLKTHIFIYFRTDQAPKHGIQKRFSYIFNQAETLQPLPDMHVISKLIKMFKKWVYKKKIDCYRFLKTQIFIRFQMDRAPKRGIQKQFSYISNQAGTLKFFPDMHMISKLIKMFKKWVYKKNIYCYRFLKTQIFSHFQTELQNAEFKSDLITFPMKLEHCDFLKTYPQY